MEDTEFELNLSDEEFERMLKVADEPVPSDIEQKDIDFLYMFINAKESDLKLDGELTASDRILKFIKNVYGSKVSASTIGSVEYYLNRVGRYETDCNKKCQSVINFFLYLKPKFIKSESQAYRALLYDVDSSRMGTNCARYSINEPSTLRKIYTREVILDEGYDKGGWYWGAGKRLFVDFKKDLSYVKFYKK